MITEQMTLYILGFISGFFATLILSLLAGDDDDEN